MTTSVPTVISISELKRRVAQVLEGAVATKDPAFIGPAAKLTADLIEEMKILANEGKLDHGYVHAVVIALEKAAPNFNRLSGGDIL